MPLSRYEKHELLFKHHLELALEYLDALIVHYCSQYDPDNIPAGIMQVEHNIRDKLEQAYRVFGDLALQPKSLTAFLNDIKRLRALVQSNDAVVLDDLLIMGGRFLRFIEHENIPREGIWKLVDTLPDELCRNDLCPLEDSSNERERFMYNYFFKIKRGVTIERHHDIPSLYAEYAGMYAIILSGETTETLEYIASKIEYILLLIEQHLVQTEDTPEWTKFKSKIMQS